MTNICISNFQKRFTEKEKFCSSKYFQLASEIHCLPFFVSNKQISIHCQNFTFLIQIVKEWQPILYMGDNKPTMFYLVGLKELSCIYCYKTTHQTCSMSHTAQQLCCCFLISTVYGEWMILLAEPWHFVQSADTHGIVDVHVMWKSLLSLTIYCQMIRFYPIWKPE